MCASASEDEVYKFRAVMIRVVHGTCCNTTHGVATQQSIMDAAISTIIALFNKHAGKDGSGSTLSKEEFQNLVTADLSDLVKNASDPGAIERLMGSLDKDDDGELTFLEFWHLIGDLACKKGGFTQESSTS
uniref:protein S100-A11 n=1 Tax=Semicossyphus pulcher TaxID=241346 RepID=UPI0037E92DD3